jgi:hypothetical protein
VSGVLHRYAIDVLDEEGRLLARVAIEPDWQPAFDWTYFDGLRAGVLPAVTRAGAGTVEPLWDDRTGAPYVAGFRVGVRAGDRAVVRTIPARYLERLAHEASSAVVARHGLPPGTVVRWIARAEPSVAGSTTESDDLDVEPVGQPLAIDEAPLAAFLAGAAVRDGTPSAGASPPVFFPAVVLEEAKALPRAAGDVETGGVLVGKLHRDTASGDDGRRELFIEITAQIPARHAVASATTLAFTPDTWAAVRSALAERDRHDEILCGWWHSHLDWCRLRACPPERRQTCSGARPFLSAEDFHLTASVFSAGHQLALLISDSIGGSTASLYGWSEGLVVARDFHVLTKGATHAETFPH